MRCMAVTWRGFNGKPYTRNYVDHGTLLQGAQIDYTHGDKPNYSRGTGKDDAPYSFSRERKGRK